MLLLLVLLTLLVAHLLPGALIEVDLRVFPEIVTDLSIESRVLGLRPGGLQDLSNEGLTDLLALLGQFHKLREKLFLVVRRYHSD